MFKCLKSKIVHLELKCKDYQIWWNKMFNVAVSGHAYSKQNIFGHACSKHIWHSQFKTLKQCDQLPIFVWHEPFRIRTSFAELHLQTNEANTFRHLRKHQLLFREATRATNGWVAVWEFWRQEIQIQNYTYWKINYMLRKMFKMITFPLRCIHASMAVDVTTMKMIIVSTRSRKYFLKILNVFAYARLRMDKAKSKSKSTDFKMTLVVNWT